MGFRALGNRQEIFEANIAHDLADSSRKPQPLRQVSVLKLAAVYLTTAPATGRILLALAFCFWLSVACSSAPRSVVPKDAPADLQATAAWESYARAASGTQTVAASEAEQIAHALLATDSAATATQAAGATQASQLATATQQAAQVTATVQAGITTATAAADQVAATQASLATTGTAIAAATEQHFAMLAQAQAATATAQTAGVTATSQAVAAEQDALALARARQLQPLRTFGPWAMGLALFALLIGLGGWGVVTAIKVWDARQRVVATGPFGKPLVLLDGPAGQRTIIDPSRFFAPALQLINGELSMPPFVDAERQNQTTARSQAIELRQAEHSPHPPIPLPPPRRAADLARYRTATEQANLPAGWRGGTALPGPHYPAGRQLPTGQLPFPADAPWSLLGREWAGQGLPLGVGARGLLVADPETYPHLLLAGTSGSGKTRYGLRPLISSALASGWQVVILDRSGLDFLPFRDHPNAYLTLLRDPGQAIDLLAQLYEVIQRRFLLLRQACVSTWGRLGSLELDDPTPGRILVVVDEFANLADALPGRERQELWRYARMIAAEGRKAGVHLALALQDPTHKSLDLRIRRNCLPLSFRVKDGDASRVVLGAGGAEQLRLRQFLTLMDRLVRGLAFAPTDGEIRHFLADRPVPVYNRPDWLPADAEGDAVAGTIIQAGHPVATLPHPTSDGGAALPLSEPMPPPATGSDAEIVALLQAGHSQNEVQRRLFGYTGGAAYAAVRQVAARLADD